MEKHLEPNENVNQDKKDNVKLIDTYDSMMLEVNQVHMDLIEIINGEVGEEVSRLIIEIEKFNGKHVQAKFKLANLLVDKLTDEVFRSAENACE